VPNSPATPTGSTQAFLSSLVTIERSGGRADEVLQHHQRRGLSLRSASTTFAVGAFVGGAEPLVVGQDDQQAGLPEPAFVKRLGHLPGGDVRGCIAWAKMASGCFSAISLRDGNVSGSATAIATHGCDH